jgi:hypothetical protein
MLQKIKMTSYAFILFLVFAFSFIALQVTTEEVEAAPGVCEPVERIRNMKDTARHSDYKVWEERCQVSGSNGQCGNTTEWPAGDGGRCAMSSAAATVSAQDVNPNAVPERGAAQNNTGEVCHPNDRITDMYNTKSHADWAYGQERCEREGVNAEVCATGWGEGRCIWGIPPQLGPLDTSVAAKSQAIEDCKAAVASSYKAAGGGRDAMLHRQRKCDP